MYVTCRVREAVAKQLSFEDLFCLFLDEKEAPAPVYRNPYTRTMYYRELPARIIVGCNVGGMIQRLTEFNEKHAHLRDSDLSKHYRRFFIPKKTSGFREINEPDDELMMALRELKMIFENEMYASHHAAAYAYVKGRCTKDAVAVHQHNKSNWFLKLDLSGFFPSTTMEFTMGMLSRIYPFGLIMESENGKEQLRRALSLAFLNGGLPMGTPFSPCLTNLIMIPFDYELSRYLRHRYDNAFNADGKGRMFAYTRYADDIHISCRIEFDYREVIAKIYEIFKHFNAPYEIKREKTHYGSVNGKNWILGVMLNGNHEITIGHKKKKQFRAILNNYVVARKGGNTLGLEELQYIMGLISYYRMVNKESTNAVLESIGSKYGVRVEECIKRDIAVG